MKKILLLGGSAHQVVAIKTAKQLGMYTVLCDYLTDNPGQYVADKFYLISTTDKDAVLEVACQEGVNGILAYASDPAAPTAAYVAEKLKLATNPYKSVEILCNKDKFRQFLSENGFNAPVTHGYHCIEDALNDTGAFQLPVMIKPVDSSGSRGATALYSWDGLKEALVFAFTFSRSRKIIIEEFIEKKHPYLIGGDIFIANGKVVLWGLLNCHRDNNVNPLVPVGKSYPLELSESDIKNVKDTLQTMIDKLNIQFGAMNVELIIDQCDRVCPIDIGPRNGGNMIPDLLGMIFGVDVVEMSVRASMGLTFDTKIHNSVLCYATHNLHSSENGIYEGVRFSDELKPYIIKKVLFKESGDKVEYFDNASKILGIIFLKFKNRKEMQKVLKEINRHIEVVLRREGKRPIS